MNDFRAQAHQLVDWMADYLERVGQERIVPLVEPGDIRGRLPTAAPEAAESFDQIKSDFETLVYPGLTHWAHPGFFGYFPANHSPPSILAEMLTATLGVQAMSWQTSPAATELEQVVMEWMRQLLGLPATFTGVIQDTASTATLVSLITARDRARGSLDRSTVYLSVEAHSSVAKGARLAGFAPELIRQVPVDGKFAMDPNRLAELVAEDQSHGLEPRAVVATVGTTSSTGLDPLRPIAEIVRRHDLWLHVDAAFAGSAAIVPQLRWIWDGIEAADSVVVNPHKWLLVNFDCSTYFVRDPGRLMASFGTSPEYLKTKYDERVVNYRDWGIQLGRRFRALKLWFVLRSYGAERIRSMIREHVALAAEFAGWIRDDPRFELLAPAPVGLVCFRWTGGASPLTEAELDRFNRRLLARINAPGDVFLTHTTLAGKFTLRLALGHLSTTRTLVEQVWDRIRAAAQVEAGLA